MMTSERLYEDRNRDTGLFGTRHPELAIAQWAEANIPRPLRGVLTVYTSGEHCPMCAAAHAWAGLGRIVFATSTLQLVDWLTGLGAAPGPVAPPADHRRRPRRRRRRPRTGAGGGCASPAHPAPRAIP